MTWQTYSTIDECEVIIMNESHIGIRRALQNPLQSSAEVATRKSANLRNVLYQNMKWIIRLMLQHINNVWEMAAWLVYLHTISILCECELSQVDPRVRSMTIDIWGKYCLSPKPWPKFQEAGDAKPSYKYALVFW
jgi:hypothetical protein